MIMRKLILLLFLLCISFVTSAQSLVKGDLEYDYFCDVILTNDNKMMIFFSDTDDDKPLLVCDSNGEPLTFISEKSMLLYMSKRGWCYVEMGIHDIHGPLISISKKAYLLKKKVTDDNQAFDFIKTIPVEQKKKRK